MENISLHKLFLEQKENCFKIRLSDQDSNNIYLI